MKPTVFLPSTEPTFYLASDSCAIHLDDITNCDGSKTSDDFWLANFSKKRSLRSSWRNWAKFFFVTVVLFWLLVFWDSRSCVVRVNATTCGSVCSHLARLHVRNSVNQLPYRTDGHGCSGNWETIRESDYLRILDANHLIASFLQGPWQLFDFYRTT